MITSYGELYPLYIDVGKTSFILLTAQLGKTTLIRLPSQPQHHRVNCPLGYISVTFEERKYFKNIIELLKQFTDLFDSRQCC